MSGTLPSGKKLTGYDIGMPPWIPITPQNSWVNNASGPPFQYRYWPLLNSVEVIGTLSGGTITNATILGTIPYTPASIHNRPIVCQGNSAAPVQTPDLSLTPLGQLEVFFLPTATSQIMFHLWFPLDA